ncbi:hypothetical protein [uncultured Pseudodesulfovibrio sp.]|uniref:hypothetical protein n=1 Tax=uncultured Pseudodesulfovibrio sp. TaxID=2035858 RepID=UPI0029C699F7|nr:hypothetical protein [uncultured Pseudodesulfovibrio sp.]
MNDKLTRITGLSARERGDALRWFARQDEGFRVRLMTKRFRIFLDLKAKKVDFNIPMLEYAAVCIAIKTEGYLAEKKYRSKKVIGPDELKVIEQRRIESAKSRPKKRQRGDVATKLAKKWGVVVSLKKEGLSYQAISEHLKEKHRIKVSRQYLHEKYFEWEMNESRL